MSRVTYQEAETYISELPKFTKKKYTGAHAEVSFFSRQSTEWKKGHPCSRHERKRFGLRVSGCDASGTGKAHRAFHISASDSDE